ncbi:hypothetical protein WMY93_034020 [Mugilogobius chulae]|uniref:NACHT domain-containing protein n=1 Tax=Mugilogobius chulae TaxID=88201 RepID=A0AAW0ML04_9GOBI
MESASRRAAAPEKTITCEDIFKARPHSPEPIRAVLTKGVAGVGKTVLTQKFSLDWAEGRANQELQLLFPFTFRELNVLRDTQFSLVELLHTSSVHPKLSAASNSSRANQSVLTKGVAGVGKTVLTQKCSLDWAEGRANQELQLLFPFTFRELNVLRDTQFSLVELLQHFFSPSKALCSFQQLQVLFIFDGLDECRLPLDFGRTRVLSDPTESVSVDVLLVNLIRGSLLPSALLWITTRPAAANQILNEHPQPLHHEPHPGLLLDPLHSYTEASGTNRGTRAAQTLTQMYVHFLVVQAKVQNIKYQQRSGADLHWTPETREMVLSLGKLAFEQLQKGNLIFYESDLSECGLDAAAASVYSGVFTQVFREEPGLYQDKVYCFIHLSLTESKRTPDLFLRFLLGLSLLTNQKLLQGLLTQTGSSSGTNQETVKYIEQKLNEKGLSAERSLNLLHCLNELNDHSLVEEIQMYVRYGWFSRLTSPAEWSAVSFLLLSSDSDLEEFDLRKYDASETALLGLLPVVKASTKALLIGCGLSPHCCGPLASVLSSSSLTHLDLSHNDLQDSGVELLCDGLKSAPCRLETLRLSGCLVSQRGGAALASALSSAHSHLTELDLSYNHPGPSAELLTALRDDPHCPWTLSGLLLVQWVSGPWLDPAGEQWMVPGLRKYSCEFSLDPNTARRILKLSEDKRTVTCVWKDQQYPDHEDRFTDYIQVLSSTGLRGRCYWEVDWSGREVSIAVSYRGIKRRGKTKECRHTDLFSSSRRSGRVSVLLDSEAGSLSFYDVGSDGKLSHLHTSICSFTEPLFPGFWLWDEGSSVSVVDLRRAPPAGPL